jgi:predicted ester cyclase
MSAESEANKAMVREITEQIWNRRSLHRIPEFYASDYVADYRPYSPPRSGHEAIRGMVERAWCAFSGYHEQLHEVVAEGNLVVAHFTISGTQTGQWGVLPPTNKRVEFDEIVILEFRDGKVVRQRGIPDNLTALRQLGVLPTPAS